MCHSPWGCKQLDTTERLSMHAYTFCDTFLCCLSIKVALYVISFMFLFLLYLNTNRIIMSSKNRFMGGAMIS